MRTDILERKADIEAWVRDGKSKAYICQRLNCKPATLELWLRRMGIEYKGKQSGFGRISPLRKHASDYLREGQLISTHRLKLLLLRDGVKNHRCESCNLTEWLGRPIPLELHHKDGNRSNNKLENLQLLCSNCHALTPNNSGRGIRRK